MKFKTLNTKNNQEYIYTESEVLKLFDCDSLHENIISKADYDNFIKNIEDFISEYDNKDEEIKSFKEYWDNVCRQVLDGADYLKALIEYEVWTSPRGVAPVFKVIEVIND